LKVPTPQRRSQPPPANGCVQCGSLHTRIVGQSGKPPVIHRRCEDCGHLSSRLFDDSADTGTASARENRQASGDAAIFRNHENNFEVMFQTKPRISEEGAVPTRRSTLFTETGASSVFEVRVAGVPPHFGTAADFLQKALNTFAGSIARPVLTTVDNQMHQGLPALRFSLMSGDRHGQGLLVLQDTTLFTVVAIGTAAADAERNDFLNSFKVLTLGHRGA